MPSATAVLNAPPMRKQARQDLSGVRDDGTLVGRGGNTQQLGAAAKRRLPAAAAVRAPGTGVPGAPKADPYGIAGKTMTMEPDAGFSGGRAPTSPRGLRGFEPALSAASPPSSPAPPTSSAAPSDIEAKMRQLADERGGGAAPQFALKGRVPGTPGEEGSARDFMARLPPGAAQPFAPKTPVATDTVSRSMPPAAPPSPDRGELAGLLRGFAPGAMPPTTGGGALPQMETADGGSPFEGLAQAALARRRATGGFGGGGAAGPEMRAY